jgi:hypothetical protein
MSNATDQLRASYLTQLALVVAADGRIDVDELCKLYQAFSLLKAPPAERHALLRALVFNPEELADHPIPPVMMQADELRLALAKDALFLEREDDPATQAAVDGLLQRLVVTPQQIVVMREWVRMENRLLVRLGAGEDELADPGAVKELTARAASVGVPVGALYMAGITGFSAVGITSGLAAIGSLTGLTLLGLNPMTAGIAGLVMAGVTVKKVADYAIGTGKAGETLAARARADEVRRVNLEAANFVAQDLLTFEVTGREIEPSRTAVVAANLREARQTLDTRAAT